VLSGWPIYGNSGLNPFSELLLKGIKNAATLLNCNLFISGGDNPIEAIDFWPAWNHPLPDAEFLPIGPANTDGLIVILPSSERMKSQIRQMKDQGHPVITFGVGVGGPSVVVDNEAGIRMALDHLYAHGHRKIAFLAGHAADTGDSLSRLSAYQSWMAEKSLPVDPRLIVYGLHNELGGQRAMSQLLSAGVEISAILASNDQSAIGAMQAIEKAGLRVPDDFAIIGFDNQVETLAQIPPLTTISAPLYQSGRQLLDLLIAYIEGETIPEITTLTVDLVIRQSCGCLPSTIQSMQHDPGPGWPVEISAPKIDQNKIASAMTLAVQMAWVDFQTDEYHLWCQTLVEAFTRSLKESSGNYFRKSLINILRRIVFLDGDMEGLQVAVSVLREHTPDLISPDIPSGPQNHFAEDLLHQARAMISESAKYRYHRSLAQGRRSAEALEGLSTLLFSTQEEAQVIQVFHKHLASVGIRHAQIIFFETSENDPAVWGVIKGPVERAAGLRFLCRQFPPPGLYAEDEPAHLVFVPLTSGDENMGFIAFDANNLPPCAAITRATAAAIRSARLYARVHELSVTDPLTGISNRRYFLDLLKKEIDRSLRNKLPLAVVMLDIDHFKRYNDTFGHPEGDEALRRVAQAILQGARRAIDIVARYGGEEFAIILPETDLQGAWTVAETIRSLVAECGNLEQRISISLGISMFQDHEISANEFIEQADKALYSAKGSGRNCTRIFGRTGPLISADS
jgi:diguanylate cyclase (GGDEF)-like protein